MPQLDGLNTASSAELARAASYSLSGPPSASLPAEMASTSGTAVEQKVLAPQDQMPEQRKAWFEAHLPFLRCGPIQ